MTHFPDGDVYLGLSGLDLEASEIELRNPSLALLSLWGALEALFSPAKAELRFRVAALIASYLQTPGTARRELHKKALRLYDHRSAAAHGHSKQDADSLLETFELLRQVVLRMISEHHVPSKEELEALLFCVDEVSNEEPSNKGLEPTPQSGAARP